MHIQAEPRTLPRVAVLLATHMGRTYLDEQIDSILDQAGADLHIFVSDDGSTDGTLELLAERADADARITILPPETFGAPAPNFFRLLTTIPIAEYDYVGFADQDDVWMPAKLERHIRLLAEGRADGISSNVTAFSEDGTRILIKKDYPQRLVDHLFETPGPGSTFLLTQRFARLVAEQLDNPHSPAREAFAHDWLIYALARSAGLRWVIDGESTVDYRQHVANAVGANTGLSQAWKRLKLTSNRRHRGQVQLTVEACIHVASADELPRLQWLHEILAEFTYRDALRLVRRWRQLRRRPRDRVALATLITARLW